VGSKRISLNYQVQGVGSSGISEVELWYTRDGHTWQKHSARQQNRPPYVAEVDAEDLYGFTLLVHNGAGVAPKPPQEGDLPQVWVEVDTTSPAVRLLGAGVRRDADGHNLTIMWRATDKNLGARPITLTYAADPSGPWSPIATHIENTGRYVWSMPGGMPHRFYVRVEATDQAGNIGIAQTPGALLDDCSHPTASIVGVEAGQESGARDQGPGVRDQGPELQDWR
jgi:hypothetical protein